jgi:hypothetical protein
MLRNHSKSCTLAAQCAEQYNPARATDYVLVPDVSRMPVIDADDDPGHLSKPPSRVGYCSPPVHSQFKPGQSGNPSGRSKGSQNLKTLFNKVLDEEISLREGADVRKITKAEAIVRGVVIGALKGDVRNTAILFRLAEQVGQFLDDNTSDVTRIERVIVSWKPQDGEVEGDA